MAYNPASHAVVNKALGPGQATPTDARSMYYDTTNFLYRPYQSLSEANTYLSLSKYRAGRFSLFMNLTGTLNGDGTYTGGTVTEYWYKEGTSDGNLVEKTSNASVSGGPTIARVAGVVSGSDQTSVLNTIFSTSGINEVIFDEGDITISGTLDCQGKKVSFENGGRLVGSGTVTNSILNAGYRSSIISPTLNVTNSNAENGRISPMWFNAKGDGSTDDIVSWQKCVDVAIYNNIRNIFAPKGVYRVTKGIVFRKDANNDGLSEFLTSMVVEGECSSYSNTAAETVIYVDNPNSFAMGFQRVKGIRVINITPRGKNTDLLSFNPYNVIYNANSTWYNGVRNNQYSPHAGFVVDPFSNASTGSGDKYPDFTAYYVNEGNGGSTDVKFTNCYPQLFVVGFAFCPHGTPQNGDNLVIEDSWCDYNKVGISLGQSQNRTISINRVKCWMAETFIDCKNYGDGTGGTPEVTGCQIAGAVKYLCKLSTFTQNNGITFTGLHGESLWSFGGSLNDDGTGTGSPSGFLKLKDSLIDLMPPLPATGAAIFPPTTYFYGGEFNVENSTVTSFNGLAYKHVHVNANQVTVRNSRVGLPIGGPKNASIKHTDCYFGEYFLGNDASLNAKSVSELNNELIPGFKGTVKKDSFASYGTIERTVVADHTIINNVAEFTNGYYYSDASGQITISGVDHDAQTASFTFTANSDLGKRMSVGQHLYSYITGEFGGYLIPLDFGRIATFNLGAGTGTLVDVAPSIGNGAMYVMFYYIPYLIPPLVLGDTTSGSASVTSCVLSNLIGGIVADVVIQSPYFPIGTRTVSYSSGTLVLTHEALATKNGVEILSANWKQIHYANAPNTSSSYGIPYRVGDRIINTEQEESDVLEWICIKSGVSNSSILPEFKTITKYQIAPKIRIVDNTDITILSSDYEVILKNSTTSKNVTLPSAASSSDRILRVVNTGTSTIVFSPTIRVNASTTNNTFATNTAVEIHSDGTDWWLVGIYTR